MDLHSLKKNWDQLGKDDPYWAVLTDPAKKGNQWDEEEFFRSGAHFVKSIFNRFQLDEKLDFGRALDFGCGPGRITQALCARFDSVVGVDISESMIAKARELNRFPYRCEYVVNAKNDLSQFADGSLDFVCSFITLQHIAPEYSQNYILEFLRVVRKGGYILFNLPERPPTRYRVLHAIAGASGLNRMRRMYYGNAAVMEMHWIARPDVIEMIQSGGGQEVAVQNDSSAGKGWESYYYLVRRGS